MATIKLKNTGIQQFGGVTPWGNVTTLQATLKTNASGAAINANSTAAIAIGDKVIVGVLEAGMRLDDCQLIVSDALTASMTCKVGFAYVDGVDSTDVPQDDDYFGTGLSLASTARIRTSTANAPVVLPKEAYLVLTTAGAACADAGRVDVIVTGVRLGSE